MKQIRRANARFGAATKENTARPQARHVVTYNSDNDPVRKYDLSILTDLGDGQDKWMSYRCNWEVIYMENHSHRSEVSLEPASRNKKFHTYRFVQPDFWKV
eukprot:TRINITY_DN5313_c0_g1_i1.p1 TRINITY_DN5313_c0_g1~~TRINITY_DN5313_c0_g1_i1.p1  ORF type:complete len:101 (+),score=15.82 TRINITY_DN5313_c0_g1_i1:585-887(+)